MVDTTSITEVVAKPGNGRTRLRTALRRDPILTVGAVIIAMLILVAIFAPMLAPYAADVMGVGGRLAPPSLAHPFGTDEFGRDVLSRVVLGSRLTLMVGLSVVSLASSIGILLGLVAAYAAGFTEKVLMRMVDVVFSFTETLIALAAVAVLGPSLLNAMIAVGIASIPFYARSCYSAAKVECGKPYVEALYALGAGHFRIIFLHLLPNVMPTMIVVSTLGLSGAVLAAAGLSFIGLGAQPPTPEWGAMLASARDYIVRAPWLLLFPGIAISTSVLGFNLLGDGIRTILDPHRGERS